MTKVVLTNSGASVKQVPVTSAQVRAARTLVRRANERGEVPDPRLLKIANPARRRDGQGGRAQTRGSVSDIELTPGISLGTETSSGSDDIGRTPFEGSTPASSAPQEPRRTRLQPKERRILIRVRGALPNLRPAERRVGEVVLQDPRQVSEISITALARQCQTSETTVLRFCRAIGLSGYPELRIALSRADLWEEEDRSSGPTTGEIGPADTLDEVVAKISHSDARAVEDTAAALDLEVLHSAVDALVKASRIDIYGIGASALSGTDLQQKLRRLGYVCFVWSESRLALTSAAMLSAGDVAIGISHTGTTIDTVDALREAHSRGATTIAVTNFEGSPLAAVSDIPLLTVAHETTFRTGSMSSRIAQLALVDSLFAAVAQRSYVKSLESLAREGGPA